MAFTVTRLDLDGKEVEKHTFETSSAAVRRYTRLVVRHKGEHIVLTKDGTDTTAPKVIAQRFGVEVRMQ